MQAETSERKEETVSRTEVERELAQLLGRVEFRGERFIVTKRGKAVAAIIGLEDLERLRKGDSVRRRVPARRRAATVVESGQA